MGPSKKRALDGLTVGLIVIVKHRVHCAVQASLRQLGVARLKSLVRLLAPVDSHLHTQDVTKSEGRKPLIQRTAFKELAPR
jgi:hypothetical protein